MSDTTGDALALPDQTCVQTPAPASDRQPDGRFAPGHIKQGGRPRGSRNKAMLALQQRFDDEADALGGKLVELARDGNMAALKLCIERLWPRPRSSHAEVALPPIETRQDIAAAHDAVIDAAASGDIEAAHAKGLAELLRLKRVIMENDEEEKQWDEMVERRLRASAGMAGLPQGDGAQD